MSTVRAGTIPSDLAVNPGDAIYVNGGGTWDTFTPSTGGGITIGDAVSGGGANRVLYEDGSSNLAASANFTYASSVLDVHSTRVGEWAGGGGYAVFGHVTALGLSSSNYAVLQASNGTTYINTASGQSIHFRIANSDVFQIFNGYTSFNATADAAVAFWLSPSASNKYGLLISGLTSQSNPLFEVRDVSNATRFNINGSYVLQHGYDNSNYWTATVSSAGAVTFDAVGASAGFTFSDAVTVNGTLTLSAQNIATDTTTGMKIGTGTTQKVGFFNATPVTQRSDIGALTDSTGGSASSTIQDCTGGDTVDLSFVNDNFASLSARINSIRTALRDMGIMA